MTTWSEVGLALAGAPVGALITVFGVRLTNKHNNFTHQQMLDSQAQQQRERLEFELRVDLQRDSLRQRSVIYLKVLSNCDWAERLADWAQADELPWDVGPLTNDDLESTQNEMPALRRRVEVHCSAGVRVAMLTFEGAMAAVNETSKTEAWDQLRATSATLRSCVIEASVLDRTSGLAADGLGGA